MLPLVALVSAWFFHNAHAARERQIPTPHPSRAATPSQRAAQAAAAGELTRARQELSAAQAEASNNVPALLVLACLELEENHLSEAREVIARLRAAAPDRPEPEFLERLLAHRQRAPSSRWGNAFFESWAALDRPDFRHSPLLPDEDSLSPDDPEAEEAVWRQTPSAPIRLTLALASPELSEERARWLLQQVPTLEDPALLAAASDVLSQRSLPAALRDEAVSALRQRLTRLVEASAPSMQPRLLLLLAGTEAQAPLDARELSVLDELSGLTPWKDTSYTRTFQTAREHLREAGVPHPGARAFLVAERATGAHSALLLLRRANATREKLSEDERRWMGRMLWRIGSRLTETSSYLEHSVGLLLMDFGADDLRDSCGQAEASIRQDELSASAIALDKAAPGRWPLPSLQEELEEARARDERAWLLFWLGKPTLLR
ncbi:tetratricopeptide repeat protein [Archangium sp.]|uniref:tetratricopeptide repeat protein n=1 Tax=Archangium sp. TaxID=1872627 RepID=UPI0038998D6A